MGQKKELRHRGGHHAPGGVEPLFKPRPRPHLSVAGAAHAGLSSLPPAQNSRGTHRSSPIPAEVPRRLAFKGNFRLLLQAAEDLVELLLELLAIPCQQAVFTGEPASLSTCRVFFSGSGGWREGQGENQDPHHRVWAGGLGGRQSPMRGVQGSGGTETQPDSH